MRTSRVMGRRFATLTITVLLVVAMGGCKGPAPVETNLVEIKNNKYVPVVVKTKIASPVTFKNTDDVIHTVTNDNAPTPNQTLKPGGEMIFNPGENGTLSFHCEIHKFRGKMIIGD